MLIVQLFLAVVCREHVFPSTCISLLKVARHLRSINIRRCRAVGVRSVHQVNWKSSLPAKHEEERGIASGFLNTGVVGEDYFLAVLFPS